MFLSFIISVSAVWRCRIHRHKVHRVVCATLARDLWCTTRTKTGDVAVETPSASLQYTSPFLYSFFFFVWLCLSSPSPSNNRHSRNKLTGQAEPEQCLLFLYVLCTLFAGQCGGLGKLRPARHIVSTLTQLCLKLSRSFLQVTFIFWMFLGVYVFCTYHSVRLSTELGRILCSTVFHQKLASANRGSFHVFYLARLRHLSLTIQNFIKSPVADSTIIILKLDYSEKWTLLPQEIKICNGLIFKISQIKFFY